MRTALREPDAGTLSAPAGDGRRKPVPSGDETRTVSPLSYPANSAVPAPTTAYTIVSKPSSPSASQMLMGRGRIRLSAAGYRFANWTGTSLACGLRRRQLHFHNAVGNLLIADDDSFINLFSGIATSLYLCPSFRPAICIKL